MSTNKIVEIAKKEDESHPERKARRDLSRKSVLPYPQLDGYSCRWVNNQEDMGEERIHMFKEAWWEPVLRKEIFGTSDSQPNEAWTKKTGRGKDGTVSTYMKLPMDLYLADQARKKEERDSEVDRKLRNKRDEYGRIDIRTTYSR